MTAATASHLQVLEGEHVVRDVAAELETPVLLFSVRGHARVEESIDRGLVGESGARSAAGSGLARPRRHRAARRRASDPYATNGASILIDAATDDTVGAGMIADAR